MNNIFNNQIKIKNNLDPYKCSYCKVETKFKGKLKFHTEYKCKNKFCKKPLLVIEKPEFFKLSLDILFDSKKLMNNVKNGD